MSFEPRCSGISDLDPSGNTFREIRTSSAFKCMFRMINIILELVVVILTTVLG